MSYLSDEVIAAHARCKARLDDWDGITLEDARQRAEQCRREAETIQAMVRGASAVSYWTWYWTCFESFRSLN